MVGNICLSFPLDFETKSFIVAMIIRSQPLRCWKIYWSCNFPVLVPVVRRSVRDYVFSCEYCQTHKHLMGLTCGRLRPIPLPDRPWQVIGQDPQGSFQETPSGKCHIIVRIDYLTKWLEAEAVSDTLTDGILKFVEEHYVFRHGFSECLISDQGPGFPSKQIPDTVAVWGIEHTFATPEPLKRLMVWSNESTELVLVISAYVKDHHAHWEDHLSAAVFAINTARQSTTEVIPFELIFRRVLIQRVEALLPWPSGDSEYRKEYLRCAADLRSNVQDRICLEQKKWKNM